MSDIFQWIINSTPIIKIRRNHGLEHATLQILSRKYPERPMAGYSDMHGFRIIGNISQNELANAVEEALQRLRSGEFYLAIHPHCGTNFVTSGLLTGLSGALMMIGSGPRWHDKINRIGMAAIAGIAVLIISQPLGPLFQSKITTCSNPGSMRITGIQTTQHKDFSISRIFTKS
ncbi:MAG: DUF6391 domain-containing protein [Chloroflexota bacterium]